jgi:hypothetical protein
MAVQDNKQQLKDSLKGKDGKLFMIILFVLLLFRIYIKVSEGGNITESGEPIRVILKNGIQKDGDEYIAVSSMLKEWVEFEQSSYKTLGRDNPFDSKLVASSKELEERAQKKLEEAQAAYERREYEQAQSMVNEVLSLQPRNVRAQELDKKIISLSNSDSEGIEVKDQDRLSTGVGTGVQ